MVVDLRMGNLHLAQVNALNPILENLKEKGCNNDKLIKKTGLHRFNLKNSDGYIPIKLLYDFYNELYKTTGISDFIEEFADAFQTIAVLQYGEMVAYASDFLTGCQIGLKYDQVLFTNERLFLKINGNRCILANHFIDNHEQGRENIAYTDLSLIINTVRLHAGKDWQPFDVYLQCANAPSLNCLLPNKLLTNVYVNQEFTGISFDTALLRNRMLQPTDSDRSQPDIKSLDTLSSKIEMLLESNCNSKLPSIEHFADFTNMSLRTFQRALSAEDKSFSQIIENWRFTKALEMLEKPSVKIKEISQRLSYSNVSSFERTFRRWTNTHPLDYRSRLSVTI